VSSAIYFGYMLIIALAFAILTGSIGFYSCFWFTRRIYAAIKVRNTSKYNDLHCTTCLVHPVVQVGAHTHTNNVCMWMYCVATILARSIGFN
jgi:hypothetical protein